MLLAAMSIIVGFGFLFVGLMMFFVDNGQDTIIMSGMLFAGVLMGPPSL